MIQSNPQNSYYYLPGDKPLNVNLHDELVRVNIAGELGAVQIYRGQIAAQAKPDKIFHELLNHEQQHLQSWQEKCQQNRLRPSILTPFWYVIGFMIGYSTQKFHPSTAHALTVAVEDEIAEHYALQIQDTKNQEYHEILTKFRDDELHHKEIALENGAESAPFYQAFYKLVRIATKFSVEIAKKF